MKKVVLTMREEERYRVIKAVVNGKTSIQRAAVRLKRSLANIAFFGTAKGGGTHWF